MPLGVTVPVMVAAEWGSRVAGESTAVNLDGTLWVAAWAGATPAMSDSAVASAASTRSGMRSERRQRPDVVMMTPGVVEL